MEEELFTQMQREDIREDIWKIFQDWDHRRITNYLVDNMPISFIREFKDKLTNLPEEELTPREAFSEGKNRIDVLERITKSTSEELLDLDKDKLIKEMCLEIELSAIQKFATHLENCGSESCSTWRSKLLSLSVDLGKDGKLAIFAYFKTQINEEELIACHKAFLKKDNWDFETKIPDGVSWCIDKNLDKEPDALSNQATWVRYKVGKPE